MKTKPYTNTTLFLILITLLFYFSCESKHDSYTASPLYYNKNIEGPFFGPLYIDIEIDPIEEEKHNYLFQKKVVNFIALMNKEYDFDDIDLLEYKGYAVKLMSFDRAREKYFKEGMNDSEFRAYYKQLTENYNLYKNYKDNQRKRDLFNNRYFIFGQSITRQPIQRLTDDQMAEDKGFFINKRGEKESLSDYDIKFRNLYLSKDPKDGGLFILKNNFTIWLQDKNCNLGVIYRFTPAE